MLRFGNPAVKVVLFLVVLTCLMSLAPPLTAQAGDDGAQAAEEVATRFLQLFAEKDLDAVDALFAPAALVQRARLTDELPELAAFGAREWADDARQGIASVEDFKIEVLDVTSLSFGEGITVSVLFRATGRVGESTFFINNGVDTFSLVEMEGDWRIVLYNSMEKLEFGG